MSEPEVTIDHFVEEQGVRFFVQFDEGVRLGDLVNKLMLVHHNGTVLRGKLRCDGVNSSMVIEAFVPREEYLKEDPACSS